jgi:chorismate dehydratase
MSEFARIGKINFANVWPVFYDFPREDLQDQCKLIVQTPTELNAAMLKDEIDMGFISTYAYLKNAEQFYLFPHFSISAGSRVSSILLFHHKPLPDIKNGHFLLVNTSATSVHLLKIIVEQFLGGEPSYSVSNPDLASIFQKKDVDAILLIGDDAIRASWLQPTNYVTDLGEYWHNLTGQAMTYAVWAIRKSFAEQHSSLLNTIYQQLTESKKLGAENIELIISRAVKQIGGTTEFWQQYYRDLVYDCNDREIQAIQFYHQCLVRLGHILPSFSLNFWKQIQSNQVKL